MADVSDMRSIRTADDSWDIRASRAATRPVRPRYVDDIFSTAMRSGVSQVVTMAAGLDSRAYRLDWPAGTTVFEIDRRKVLEYTAATLGAHGAVATSNRVDWPATLIAAGFGMARLSRPVSEELADEGMDTTLLRGRLEGVTQ